MRPSDWELSRLTANPGYLVRPAFSSSNTLASNGIAYYHQTANGQNFDGTKPYALSQAIDNATRFRFEVHSGDYSWNDSNHGLDRSELDADVFSTAHATYGSDKWVSYAFMIEPGAILSAVFNQYCILGQWHNENTNPRSPVYEANLQAGDILQFGWRNLSNPSGPVNVLWSSGGAFSRGIWHYVVIQFHADASGGGAGFINLWLDGTQIGTVSGIDVGYSDESFAYWKFGAYRAQAPEVFAVQYANMEVSNSSLAARVSAPLPLI